MTVQNYKVWRNGALIASPTGLVYSDTGLTPATAYQYQVSAVDNAGNESAKSSIVTATTQAAGSNPAILLEDFASVRKNGDGDDLFNCYLGEDAHQTYSVIAGPWTRIITTSPSQIYFQFFPRDGGYFFPTGYLQGHTKSGSWTAGVGGVNRMSILARPNSTVARDPNGPDNLQIGTYVRGHSDPDGDNQGAHYYHLLGINWYAGKVHKIVLNACPQHQVGQLPTINWGSEPESPLGYYDGMTRFYFDVHGEDGSPDDLAGVDWDICGYYLDKAVNTPDSEISSMCIVYTGTHYEVTWAGIKNTSRTYEVLYGTSKFTTFSGGTSGGTTNNPGDAYTGTLWTSPNMAEQTPGLYVAVRVQSASQFAQIFLPNNCGPGNIGPINF